MSGRKNETTRAPPGLPTWISPALIDQTITVWQPYYATPLTANDAAEMLLSVSHLLEVVSCRRPDEE